MASITVKNIPDELYARLKAVAESNRRSINGEIIVCIEQRDPIASRSVCSQISRFVRTSPILAQLPNSVPKAFQNLPSIVRGVVVNGDDFHRNIA